MAIDLYYMPASAPCRSIIMLAKELGIELNLKLLDLRNGEHLKPEFVAINPQHCIPTLVDDGFALWESRAILQYLANKTNSNLYPTDPKKRAIVDRLLFFDLGTMYKAIGEYAYPQLFAKQPADEEKLKKVKEALAFLDGFLEGTSYVAGESLTIADLTVLASLSFIEVVLDFDFSEHKNVAQWLAKLKGELSYYKEVNEEPLKQFKEFVGK